MSRKAELRRNFLRALWAELTVLWPILSGLILFQLVLGAIIARVEGWPAGSGAYFAFVTGLTIGYGDLAPTRFVMRLLAVLIGFSGILLTGLVAATGVNALRLATSDRLR